MATIADLIDNFTKARVPLVQALEQAGPVNLTGPNGVVYQFRYDPSAALELTLEISKPAASITVTVAPTTPGPTPSTNATPTAPPSTTTQ